MVVQARCGGDQLDDGQVDAGAALHHGNGVDDRIGRPADGTVDTDGVFERALGEDLRHRRILLYQFNDAPAGKMRQHMASRVGCAGDGCVVWQADAERLDHAGHGGGRAPIVCTGAGRAALPLFRRQEILDRDPGLLVLKRTGTWVPNR